MNEVEFNKEIDNLNGQISQEISVKISSILNQLIKQSSTFEDCQKSIQTFKSNRKSSYNPVIEEIFKQLQINLTEMAMSQSTDRVIDDATRNKN